MMDYKVIKRSSPPIELDEAKRHVKAIMYVTAEDDDIETMIAAAEEYAENFTGRTFGQKEIVAYPRTFAEAAEMPRSPVIEVLSVEYTAPDGTTHTLDVSACEIVNMDGGIVFSETPDVSQTAAHPIRIRYRAGYIETPFMAIQAMKLLIGHWYVNRETVIAGANASVEVDMTTRALLRQYKVWWF